MDFGAEAHRYFGEVEVPGLTCLTGQVGGLRHGLPGPAEHGLGAAWAALDAIGTYFQTKGSSLHMLEGQPSCGIKVHFAADGPGLIGEGSPTWSGREHASARFIGPVLTETQDDVAVEVPMGMRIAESIATMPPF